MNADERSEEQKLLDGLYVVPVKDRPRGLLGHAFDGRFGPMDPAVLQGMVDGLVRLADLSGVTCVLGIPEGGTVVAFAFASAAGLPLVLSSRMSAALANPIYFEEPHSVTADRHNFIYGLRAGDRVVIVDDEITTGRTLVNAVRALRAAGVIVDQLVVLVASEDPTTLARLEGEGLVVHAASRMSSRMTEAIIGVAAPA